MSSFWIEPLDEPVMPELRGDFSGTDGYNSRRAFALEREQITRTA